MLVSTLFTLVFVALIFLKKNESSGMNVDFNYLLNIVFCVIMILIIWLVYFAVT